MGDCIADLLFTHGVEETAHRRQVLELLADAQHPLSAQDMLDAVHGGAASTMNRVTLYRILDLFVQKGMLERHHDGDKSWRYCLPSSGGAHCHFYCRLCGRMECLGLDAHIERAVRKLPVRVENVDIRFDGVCAACEEQRSPQE